MIAQSKSIFLITGPVQGGKTTYLSELTGLLKKRGLTLGGFLCPGRFDSGERSGFNLKNIVTGTELPMASNLDTDEWIKFRRFWFNPDTFKQGMKWIESSQVQESDVVVIDEVGPMELEGSGWSELLKTLVISPIPVQLWSVRENLLEEVMQQWDISTEQLIRIDKLRVEKAAELISEFVEKRRESQHHQ